jgi:predicted N-acetyltransferase YhbS
MQVERASVGDYAELIGVMNRSFAFDLSQRPGFEQLYPDLYQPTESSAACHRILRADGQIVSSVGVYPIEVQVGDVRLSVAGVGAVCTTPEVRGKGYMSKLLNEVNEDMARDGYALSWLSGDRARYARFGWERAGSASRVEFLIKPGNEQAPGWDITRFTPGTSDPAEVLRSRQQVGSRGLCPDNVLTKKFSRANTEVWEARSGKKHAFCALNLWDKQVMEWGGDVSGVKALLEAQTATGDVWAVNVPPVRDAYTDMFLSLAENIGHRLDNLTVIDLAKLVQLYEPYLANAWPEGRSLRLAIRGEAPGALSVVLEDGRVADAGSDAGAIVELDRLRMVRFLFGPACPTLTADLAGDARWLDQVFPLPFYMPYLWRV